MHIAIPPLFLTQLFECAVGWVEGEQFRWTWPAEGLAQLQQSCTQVQEKCIWGVHLKEDLRHLIGPDLGSASISLQAAAQPGEQQVAGLTRPLEQVFQDLVQLVMKLAHKLQTSERRKGHWLWYIFSLANRQTNQEQQMKKKAFTWWMLASWTFVSWALEREGFRK